MYCILDSIRLKNNIINFFTKMVKMLMIFPKCRRITGLTMRVAMFGSSYVKRASYFDDFVMPFEVEWFGVDDMTASQPCPSLISKMMRYSPDIVVVRLGGNDLCSGTEPSTFTDCLTSLFHKLRDFTPDNSIFSSRRRYPEEIYIS